MLSAFFLFLGLTSSLAQGNLIYHYSVLEGMRNGVYIGEQSISSLHQKGDFGLGTYNNLNGEMIALDGVFYRIAPDGKVSKADEMMKVPFASVTKFNSSSSLSLNGIKTTAELQQQIVKRLPSANFPYALKIHITFEEVIVGGANRVSDTDTTGIAALMKVRPQYKKQNVSGTLVGFYNPPYMGGVDLSPFHFHFISDDKSFAGHLMDGRIYSVAINVNFDEKDGYQIILPRKSAAFNKVWNQNSGAKDSY